VKKTVDGISLHEKQPDQARLEAFPPSIDLLLTQTSGDVTKKR
jgi:hypothetical protein